MIGRRVHSTGDQWLLRGHQWILHTDGLLCQKPGPTEQSARIRVTRPCHHLEYFTSWIPNGPVRLGQIDLTYKKRMLFVNVRFMSCCYPSNAFVFGDVHIPVSCKLTAELVISPPEFVIFYMAMCDPAKCDRSLFNTQSLFQQSLNYYDCTCLKFECRSCGFEIPYIDNCLPVIWFYWFYFIQHIITFIYRKLHNIYRHVKY